MASPDDLWLQWLTEAHEVVERWEQARGGTLLSVADAAVLAEHIARALQSAAEKGQPSAEL